MTPQLQALTLAFVLFVIWMVKEERDWRKEFKKDDSLDEYQGIPESDMQ
jgi:hypothetical protein